MNSRYRGVIVLCGAFLALAASPSFGAEPAYPTRPVRLLVPFAPGGGADTIARIITPKLHESLGQPWVVDNRGGAAGNLAAETVVNAAPDGYTVFHGIRHGADGESQPLQAAVQRGEGPAAGHAARDRAVHTGDPSGRAGRDSEGIHRAREAEAEALQLRVGGRRQSLHLAAELFKKRAGVNMVHVPYKGGGPAAAAVLAGETQVLFGSVASSMQQVKAGKLKALATTGAKRSKVAPELPTIAESGFPGFDVSSWYGLLVPARTPAPIVNRLRDAAIKVVALPDVQEAMGRQGLEVETSTPQELAARIKTETRTWADVIKSAGIKAE